ncbi:MAG: spore cortex biosynthesis protein YabQ [Anaerotignum sp.]
MDIQGQGSLFLCCLLLGGGMGLVYDGMRLARRILPHGVWAVQIEDGLYWAAVALGVFEVLLKENHGEVRFFLLVAVFGGMGIYGTLASPLVMGVGEKVLKVIGKLVMLLLTIIFTPFRLVYLAFGKPVGEFRQILRWKIQKTLAIM